MPQVAHEKLLDATPYDVHLFDTYSPPRFQDALLKVLDTLSDARGMLDI